MMTKFKKGIQRKNCQRTKKQFSIDSQRKLKFVIEYQLTPQTSFDFLFLAFRVLLDFKSLVLIEVGMVSVMAGSF